MAEYRGLYKETSDELREIISSKITEKEFNKVQKSFTNRPRHFGK